jgi:glycyl-tRNA synthetase (class II)
MNKSLDQTVEIFNSFLKDKLYHNNLMIINKQDLPFYSKKTIDLEYISSDSKANEIIEGLEVSSSSQRQEKIIEVSMGVMRLFITLLVDSEREDGSIVIKDEKLKRLLKESNTKFSKKIV